MASLAPSVISANYTCLGDSLRAVEEYATSWHVDVMDGHYVPNLTIGPMVMDAISRISTLPQDVHVMISNVDETWEWYAKAGARRIAYHHDQCADPVALADLMRGAGIGPGLAINPDVEVTAIEPYVDSIDHVIVMSVFPGFSGQKFIPDALPKLERLRKLVDDRGGGVELYIDGGVNPGNAAACVEAGADILISASAIFASDDPPAVAKRLLEIAGT